MYLPDPGVAQLCGTLEDYGISPIVFDLNLPQNTFTKFLSMIRREKPNIIGFKFFDTGFRGILQLASIIRKELPDCYLIAAGPHVTLFREHIFHQTSIFDFIVIGEGEITIIDLIEYISGKRKRSDISNVMYVSDSELYQNETKLIDDLDKLSFPSWQSLNLEKYFPLVLLNDHRGCYNICAFCAHNYLWGYRSLSDRSDSPYQPLIRKKSLSRLVQETENCIRNLGIHLFGFTDSSPIPNRLIEWSEYLINIEERVYWTSFANINQFSLKDFSLFKKSGCKSLWIGVESGDERLLKIMGKNYSRQDVIDTFSELKHNGIIGVPGFIIGFPGESNISVNNTLSLLRDIETPIYVISPFILDPGTPVALNSYKYGVQLDDDWECKIILRDDLNEFEIPYYKVNGIPNNEVWAYLEKITPYKGWDADRTIAESEYAAVLAAALDIPIDHFVRGVTEALSSPDPELINKIIKEVWEATL